MDYRAHGVDCRDSVGSRIYNRTGYFSYVVNVGSKLYEKKALSLRIVTADLPDVGRCNAGIYAYGSSVACFCMRT